MSRKTGILDSKQRNLSRAAKPARRKTAAPRPRTSPAAPKISLANDTNFELLFSQNPHAMYVIDRETLRFLEVNAAAIRQYGYSRQEFLSMQVTEIRPPEDVPRVLQSIAQQPRGVTSRGHWRHRRKNGQVFDVEVMAQSIRFAGRDAVLSVGLDVSDRYAAEEKVAQHTAYLHSLTETNPLGIVTVDADHRVQMCNPAFERLFDYTLAEIRGKTLESLIAPDGSEEEMAGLIRRADLGERVRMTVKRRRRDGSLLDVRVLGVPLLVNGESRGSFAMYEDITERLRAEESQRVAEERYRRIFDNAVEGFFESTPAGRFVTVNPAMARIAGYASPAEMIREVHDIGQQLYVEPETRKDVKRRLEQDGILEGYECHMLRKDGRKIWISMNVRALRDASGKIVTHDGTAVEITERKRSDLERQTTTDIIHAMGVTDNLDDLLRLIHQAIHKVVPADNCFIALYEPSGIVHFPFFVDRHDPHPKPQKLKRGAATYVFKTGQPMIISAEQHRRLVESGELDRIGTPARSWLGVPLRTPAAKLGVLAVRDCDHDNAYTQRDLEFLTSVGGHIALAIERKRGEEALRENEARLRVLIEQLPAVLWTVDRDLRFTSMLGAGLARLDLKQNELVGTSLMEYFETTDRTFVPIAAHHRAIAGEPSMFHVEWKSGSYTCHVEALRDAAGAVQGAICMALDVTDRKQLEEQFRQAQKMEAVGRLAGGIAHDFNNLLMVIQGYADLLAERLPVNDPLHRNAEQIQSAAQRASGLTRQLLAFSRKQIMAPAVLNVHTIVADLEKILRRMIGEDVHLETSTSPDLWLVKADRSQIEQVVMNLAVNARDAMPNGGRLTIETSNVEFDASRTHAPAVLVPGKYVMLAVTDNGCGMDEKTQAHIFEPFFTTKEQGKGTGLGLATVYGVVKQSGGYIWVYSEPGLGTTFKIYLPKIEEDTSAGRHDTRIGSASLPRGSEVVLLVEDEKGVRELAREYLEMSGYTVLEAENGHTALELAAMHVGPIHLLLTDVVMPGISGRELADRIVNIRPEIKILYMSGYTDQSVVRHGVLQADAVLLQKPFTLASLASKLREILPAPAILSPS
jgi:two-component system, cell cycle sensor histidine kinase and response regulator CckA